jgi:GAF domain-containing protein
MQSETAMPTLYQAEEKFHEALRALIGAAPQRKRLEDAYLDHLSDLEDAELPISQQAKFLQLRDTLTHGRQLDPEIAIEVMSDVEVAEAARQILALYDGIMDAARSSPSPK